MVVNQRIVDEILNRAHGVESLKENKFLYIICMFTYIFCLEVSLSMLQPCENYIKIYLQKLTEVNKLLFQ